MDKQDLKKVLEDITSGDIIDVAFNGNKSVLNGKYKVLTSKVGKGKGGSRIASLESMTDHSIVSIGTKENFAILNIVHNGQKHGYDSAVEEQVLSNANDVWATELKEKLKPLIGFGGNQIHMTSRNTPELSGAFTLVSAELSKGRFGQVILHLKNNTSGKELKFWSHRHAGLIDTISID
jgi:hypothetical protein